MTRPSIYEFAGGDPAFLALAAAHHERCLQDPELNHPFSHGTSPQHLENLAAYWADVRGLHEAVLQYAPSDAQVPKTLHTPRWSWDGPE